MRGCDLRKKVVMKKGSDARAGQAAEVEISHSTNSNHSPFPRAPPQPQTATPHTPTTESEPPPFFLPRHLEPRTRVRESVQGALHGAQPDEVFGAGGRHV